MSWRPVPVVPTAATGGPILSHAERTVATQLAMPPVADVGVNQASREWAVRKYGPDWWKTDKAARLKEADAAIAAKSRAARVAERQRANRAARVEQQRAAAAAAAAPPPAPPPDLLTDLPEELFNLIMSYTDGMSCDDVARRCGTSKAFNEVCKDERFWEWQCRRNGSARRAFLFRSPRAEMIAFPDDPVPPGQVNGPYRGSWRSHYRFWCEGPAVPEEWIIRYLENGNLRLTPFGPPKKEDLVKVGNNMMPSLVRRAICCAGPEHMRNGRDRNLNAAEKQMLNNYFTSEPFEYEFNRPTRDDLRMGVTYAWYTGSVLPLDRSELQERHEAESALEHDQPPSDLYFPLAWEEASMRWKEWMLLPVQAGDAQPAVVNEYIYLDNYIWD